MKLENIHVTDRRLRDPGGGCQYVADILVRVGDKWSVLIVMMLGDGPRLLISVES